MPGESAALSCAKPHFYLTCSKRLCCQMNAEFVIIERQARLELTCPIRTGDLTVHGQAAGNFECSGSLWIARGGLIEGRISASSIICRMWRNTAGRNLDSPGAQSEAGPARRRIRFLLYSRRQSVARLLRGFLGVGRQKRRKRVQLGAGRTAGGRLGIRRYEI